MINKEISRLLTSFVSTAQSIIHLLIFFFFNPCLLSGYYVARLFHVLGIEQWEENKMCFLHRTEMLV